MVGRGGWALDLLRPALEQRGFAATAHCAPRVLRLLPVPKALLCNSFAPEASGMTGVFWPVKVLNSLQKG